MVATSTADDFTLYQSVQREWMDLINRGLRDEDQDKLFELFTRNEEIKNRHGGMPPKNPNA